MGIFIDIQYFLNTSHCTNTDELQSDFGFKKKILRGKQAVPVISSGGGMAALLYGIVLLLRLASRGREKRGGRRGSKSF